MFLAMLAENSGDKTGDAFDQRLREILKALRDKRLFMSRAKSNNANESGSHERKDHVFPLIQEKTPAGVREKMFEQSNKIRKFMGLFLHHLVFRVEPFNKPVGLQARTQKSQRYERGRPITGQTEFFYE